MPLLAGRAARLPASIPRLRLALAAVCCAAVPDLDVVAPVFDLRGPDLLGHRGLLHSLGFAAVLAGALTVAFFRTERPRVFALLFFAGASHGLVDLFTRGDVGVALFSPFSRARLLSPLRPLPVCPLGVPEYFGKLGAIVLFDELLLLLVPLAIVTRVIRRFRDGEAPSRALTTVTLGWVLVTATLWLLLPALFAPTRERLLRGYGARGSDEDLGWIPKDRLPEQQLVTRFSSLEPLLGRELTPAEVPWSGSFFPAWFGSEAGRWADSRFTLLARTLTGTSPPAVAGDPAGLAPTEKYDLAHDDPSWAATRASLDDTHNRRPRPRFWFGLCNGVAAASMNRPEPYRTVEVVSPSGRAVRFHPIDVKALLAKSYYWGAENSILGGICQVSAFDVGERCSMNPGGLFVATLNTLGRARRSFMVEVHPTAQSQYYAVAAARVDVTRPAYARTTEPVEEGLAPRIDRLVDVDFSFTLSSTMLPLASEDEPASRDGDYQRVGLHPVPFTWSATLALDASGDVIGGRWRGEPGNGPDNVAFSEGGPLLVDGGTGLEANPHLDWPFIDALAKASVDDTAPTPRLTLDGGSP
ncbi:MAG: metal-dependent hydrolase [Archangiaceae bacterium]|nr:metal-dependent hydrolase [Archangiaceae bacterium]